MCTGRPKAELNLSEMERETLERWGRRPKTAQALARRSRIIIFCATGVFNRMVAEKMHVSKQCVSKWRGRFTSKRLEGLLDEPRAGAPRTISDAKIERTVSLTLESTAKEATHWSSRMMAKKCGLSRSTVQRIWQAFALQPRRSETFKLSTDPLFIKNSVTLSVFILNPRSVLWCYASMRKARSEPLIGPSLS